MASEALAKEKHYASLLACLLAGAGLWNVVQTRAWTSTWTCAALLDALFDSLPLYNHTLPKSKAMGM